VAFNDVVTGGQTLCAFVGLSSGAKCTFNFGKTSFNYPQEPYHSLHSQLSENQMKQLGRLFIKYRDISNQSLIEDKQGEQNQTEEATDSIHNSGLQQFQKDLGVTDEDDPILLIILWKLRSESLWGITRDEFMNGFSMCGCAGIDKIKSVVKEWRKELKNKDAQFKNFYNYVFDCIKENRTAISTDEATMAWNIILKDRKWCMYDQFVKFLRENKKNSISRDAWQQLWHFTCSYPKDLKDYDPGACWPLLYDEFVEWMNVTK